MILKDDTRSLARKLSDARSRGGDCQFSSLPLDVPSRGRRAPGSPRELKREAIAETLELTVERVLALR